jgi:2-haloacid dehalogenase
MKAFPPFETFECITFDCYGTLIDWETGILRAVRSAFPGLTATDPQILQAYSEIEPALQQGPFQKYRDVLRGIVFELAKRFERRPTNSDVLAESLGDWEPFPDTIHALHRLRTRFKLAVISNIDDDLFAGTASRLKVPFDHVITAEQVRAYKPNPRNFQVALDRIGLGKEKVLHVAESLFHDIAPARKLGIANVWVNRRAAKTTAASKTTNVLPDLEVRTLDQLANLAVAAAPS